MSPLDDRAAFAAVDDALRNYPVIAPPPTFAPAVMARVRALAPAPRFQLAWIDYALALFGAGMVGLVAILCQTIPPEIATRVYFRLIALQQLFECINEATPIFGMFASAGCAGIALATLGALGISGKLNSPVRFLRI
jgi:hypothetical protein